MNEYMIPANSKKGQLIFNLFYPIDLGVLAIGAVSTIIMFFATSAITNGNIFATLSSVIPIGIAVLLVVPVANYHNVMTFLKEVYVFYTTQKQYRWKGWCATSGIGSEEK